MKTLAYISILTLLAGQALATKPVASNVMVTGTNHVGATLTGLYDFSDADGDLESGTTYQWYRSDDQSGTNKTAIAGANAVTYVLTTSDFGKYITFEVTPRDDNAEVGDAVESNYTDQIYDFPDKSYSNNATHNVSGREDYGNFSANNKLTINVGNGDSLIIWLNFDVWNQTDIFVDPGGYFEVKGDFGANNNPDINIDGDMLVSGDLNVSQNATFNITSGGSLEISGNLTAGDNGDLNIEGDVVVDGNLDVGNNTTIDVDMDGNSTGTLTIGGDLIGGTGTTINGSGPVSVGGSVSGNVSDPDNSQLVTLPVELVNFYAVKRGENVELNWITASELNNDYFTVERSTDGANFYSIGTVKGAGNSNTLKNYNFTDNATLNQTSYYRIKQTDFDGQFSYSKIVSITTGNGFAKNSEISTFPNPANNASEFITLQVKSQVEMNEVTIHIINMNGIEVYSEKFSINSDAFSKTIPISDFSKGNYIIILATDNQIIKDKVVVM